MGKLKEAADAAATVLAEQPEHEIMRNNLKYYLTEGEIQPETVKNRELKVSGFALAFLLLNERIYNTHLDFVLMLSFQVIHLLMGVWDCLCLG